LTVLPEDKIVARKPNYQFERQERDRAKAAKKAEKAAAKGANSATDVSPAQDPSAGASPPKD
jgi:hypothetical protein